MKAQYTNPLIRRGDILCERIKERRPYNDKGYITTFHIYECPYCLNTVERPYIIVYPMRRIQHTAECAWGKAWKNKKYISN